MKVTVYHRGYGCDTGCCGHAIKIDGEELRGSFDFTHPYCKHHKQWAVEFAQKVIEEKFGPEHTFDLDWENCEVIDD